MMEFGKQVLFLFKTIITVHRRQRRYLADLEREKKEVTRMLKISKSARSLSIIN